MRSKVAPVFSNVMKYFSQDKRTTNYRLFKDYTNRKEPRILPPDVINSLTVLFHQDPAIDPKSLKKAVDFLKQDFELSKDGFSDSQLQSFKVRIGLYERFCGDSNSDAAIKMVKESGIFDESVQCLLLQIMYKEKGSVVCYYWMKSLLSMPWIVQRKSNYLRKRYFEWSESSSNLLLKYLCIDKKSVYALKVIEDMEKLSLPLDIGSYNSLLSCFSGMCKYQCLLLTKMNKEKGSKACYYWMKSLLSDSWTFEKNGYQLKRYTWSESSSNLLLKYLCTDYRLDYALKVIEDMESLGLPLSISSYNSLLSCFSFTSDYQSAVNTFQKLKDNGLLPTQETFNWMINCALRSKEYFGLIRIQKPMEEVKKYREMMKTHGFHDNVWIFNSIMKYYFRKSDFDKVFQTYREATDYNLKMHKTALESAFRIKSVPTVISMLRDFQRKGTRFHPTLYRVLKSGLKEMKLGRDVGLRDVMKQLLRVSKEIHGQEKNEQVQELIERLVDQLIRLQRVTNVKSLDMVFCSLMEGVR